MLGITTFKGTIPVEDWSGVGESINNSINRFQDINRQEEARKRKQRSEDEAKYLADAKQDPVYTASSFWQQDQAKKLQELQTHVGEVYRSAKQYYHPDLQGKLDIQNHLAAFNMYQQKIKGGMNSYEQAYKQIESDPNGIKFDHQHFAQRVKEWMDPKGNGELGEDLLLPPMIGDRAGWWLHKDNKSAGEDITVTDKNGIRTTVTKPMEDPEKQKQYHKEWVFNPKNAGYVRTMMEDWADEKPDVKEKYLENDGDERSAILDWDFDTAGKNAFGAKTKTAPVPSPFKFDRLNKVQVTPSSEGDELPLNMGKYPHKTGDDYWEKNVAGKPQVGFVKYEGDGYAFAPKTVGTVHPKEEYDTKTGKIKKSKPGSTINMSNVEVKYVPTSKSGDMQYHRTDNYTKGKYYLDKDGNVKNGYKLQAIVLNKNGSPIPLTEEFKDQLRTAFPDNVETIDNIPLTISKGEQDPDYKEESTKSTKASKSSAKELKGTKDQLQQAASKKGMTIDQYKKTLEKQGYKVIVQ